MNLFEVLKDIEKVSGKGSVMRGVEVKDIDRIPLPPMLMNRMLYGGLPVGRLIEFYGAEHSGKTTTALMAMSAYQKMEKEKAAKDTKYTPRPCMLIDAEGTYDAIWAKKLGLDSSEQMFIKWAPENVTAEQVFQSILDVAETNEVGLIVLDSIPVLIGQQEDAKNMEQLTMGGIAAPLTKFTRKLCRTLMKNPTVTFIGINQVRDNMTGYGDPITTPGGKAWKHMTSLRLLFKSENIDANGNAIPEANENPAGVRIYAHLKKNKTAPRDKKLGSYTLDFVKGFDEKQDVLMCAIKEKIVVTSGAGVKYIDKETGEIVSALGKANFKDKMVGNVYDNIKKELEKIYNEGE